MKNKYISLQSKLSKSGGKAVRGRIKKMSLKDRFIYLLKVIDNERLNPVVSKFLKANFFNELSAIRKVVKEFGGFQYFTESTLSRVYEEYQILEKLKSEK